MGKHFGRLVLMVAVATALIAARPALGQEHEEMPGDGILPPGDWTEEQVMAAHDIVERTEEALPQFADSTQLEALGFYNFGVAAPGGYDHWINPGWIDDDHIMDPNFPESLVFRSRPDGGYELQAAMFYLPTGTTLDTIPEELRWWPGWHTHDELCVDESGRFTGLVDMDGTCAVGQPADMPPMMHVWIVDNECGHRFASIEVSGINCDVTHPHDPEEPEHPDHPDHPENPEHPSNPAHKDPTDPDHTPEAPPAHPLPQNPTFTG